MIDGPKHLITYQVSPTDPIEQETVKTGYVRALRHAEQLENIFRHRPQFTLRIDEIVDNISNTRYTYSPNFL
jgi:hypothetical protein